MDPGTSSGSKATRLVGFPHVRFSVRSQCPLMARIRPTSILSREWSSYCKLALRQQRGSAHCIAMRQLLVGVQDVQN